ncbi:ribonuclease T [Sulfurimonas gotlandica GD1]|uniref:Ribonuclease T n=1 Tax=Sulfurimonas gotlandica (strain DSM 19862 / JCM 16533 / GD1) TaxID=929558 RepID=B6BLR0_SULGG|nr:3'-5' exonuclease [Sulfurimonas gotlandica]EDZ62168.1 exonuclease superfamily protein [Sulfurimonas gotlandica GD1]EHP28720.1 ribonuclease T [Sulfurimonas gotlandica GD1]
MIILDFETNSANIHDVIEVAAFRVEKVNDEYVVKDSFHRYYLSEYEVNPHALAVHKLSPDRLERLRAKATYEEHFEDDTEFVEFCKDAKTLVAHNISFELRHIGSLLSFEKHFCTMKENKKTVDARNIRGNIKNPKLIETCAYYNIDFDDEQYHSAIYDVTKTLEILNKMDDNLN